MTFGGAISKDMTWSEAQDYIIAACQPDEEPDYDGQWRYESGHDINWVDDQSAITFGTPYLDGFIEGPGETQLHTVWLDWSV